MIAFALVASISLAGCFGRSLGEVNSEGTITGVDTSCATFTTSDGTTYVIFTPTLPLPSGLTVGAYPPRIVGPDGATFAAIGDHVVIVGQAFEPGGDTACGSPLLRVTSIEANS
jgi:hypothetical protein